MHLQRPAVLAQVQSAPPQTSAAAAAAWLNPGLASQGLNQQSLQVSQQKMRLQSLQLERERLKLRQQEIIRQEIMMRQSSSTVDENSATTELGGASGPAGMDPFLSGLTDHSRQESADSGLGMGNSYSLPHTPDDFLASMDDNMDGVNEGGPASQEMTSLDAPDISSLSSDNIDSTDDLVPSLQLSEDISSDILYDVQSLINTSRNDNGLTWL
ncbi:hypothetical protein B566_EDAN015928 [Ephemera danica]|nr:hypothetical protein B566_EDAN015928 [Ephemera danica]